MRKLNIHLIYSMIILGLHGTNNSQTIHDVTVANFSFTPSQLTISVGDTVRWTNILGTHNIVADDNSFTNGPLAPAPWEYTLVFTDTGSNPYYCALHGGPGGLGMSGVIIVIPLTTFSLSVNVMDGWNMVSIPGLYPTNQNVSTWWPNRNLLADVYRWTTTYVPVTLTAPTQGYWMLHTGAHTYNTGDEWPVGGIQIVAHDPIPLTAGWNMIGGYENIPLVSGLTTTPPGLIVPGTIYGWTGTYTNATNLVPGYGYWILSNGNGVINPPTLADGSAKLVVQEDKSEWGKITITDASGKSYVLYSVDGKVNLAQYQMPPLPPTGMFDVRYGSNRKAENLKENNQTIEMQGLVYPVTVGVEKMGIRLEDETGKLLSERLKSGEEVTITNSSISKLKVSGDIIPDVYALEQNYPNPFNPSTKIEFNIPEDGNVKLKVFNLLGQEVRTLVNGFKESGTYTINFDAVGLNSGVYIYKIESNNFSQTRKMTLLK